MNIEIIKSLNFIIERDSKDTTYKFALLRSVIETVQYFDHLKKEEDNMVIFPLGLLIEKWILYYYPLIENKIPQKHGENKSGSSKTLAFKPYLEKLVSFYKDKGGISVFYSDYKNGNLPEEIRFIFLELVKKLKSTITNMPMKYLGKSYYQKEYSIFNFNKDSNTIRKSDIGKIKIDREFLIKNFGTFSFSKELYVVFIYFGSFLNGTESIIYKWAEFSAKMDESKSISVEKVLEKLLTSPENERNVELSKKIYRRLLNKNGKIVCVWSKKPITEKTLNIDHVLPFSIWQNNDLWNLLPAHKEINQNKKDKIPSPELIKNRSELISYYWRIVFSVCKDRFEKEIYTNLIGLNKNLSRNQLFTRGIISLTDKVKYLIDVRGYEPWNI
ncbi:HNH endonuclease domain-containing protein [Persephonella sp.]